MVEPGSKFTAGPQFTGYLYQCRFSLYLTLKKLRLKPQLTISFETLDDVVFETAGSAREIIEFKHHINRIGDLSDTSTDLWRTLNIWIELLNSQILEDTIFYLMTTGTTPDESAVFHIKKGNFEKAERKLMDTARTSVNQQNKPIYRKFQALDKQDRQRLLKSITIVDRCPLATDLDELLQEEVWLVCDRKKVEQFVNYLEGWWFARVIRSLNEPKHRILLGEELESRIGELREDFKEDSLPIHDDLRSSIIDEKRYENFVFVHQLKLIQVTSRRIAFAINNYYRAFEQRSRWIREDLILIGDIDRYEQSLIEEWTIRFETMKENLGVRATEEEKIKYARAIYEWVEQEANFSIRPRCQEPFITRGSYQILSDRGEVGWHVEFKQRLATILK